MTDAFPLLTCLLLGLDARADARARGGAVPSLEWLQRQVKLFTQDRRIRILVPRKLVDPMRTNRAVEQEVADASFVLAEVSGTDPTIGFYLGQAHAQGKPLVLLRRFDAPAAEPLERIADFSIVYEDSVPGREEVAKQLRGALDAIAKATELDQTLLLGQVDEEGVAIDWSQLSATAHENLCLELLLADGFVEPRWLEGGREVDLVALLPEADGRNGLHLISIGSGLADPFALAGWTSDLELLEPVVANLAERFELAQSKAGASGKTPIDLLFVWSPREIPADDFQVEKELVSELGNRLLPLTRSLGNIVLRIRRMWGRPQLDSLVRASPMVLRRYFVDDPLLGSTARVGSQATTTHLERRLGVEDLYRQAMALGRRAAEATGHLEKRLEEDPAKEWQRRAYSVTHSIGNAIFPVETYVDLARDELQRVGSLDGIENMDRSLASIEKAKIHIQRFKTIARWQDPVLTEVEVMPRLRASLATAQARGVEVSWYVDDHGPVIAEPDLFDELMDELVTNSLSWLEGLEEKRIVVTIKRASRDDLPSAIAGSPHEFLWVRYEDSGPGVDSQLKEKIFDLFFSTNPQGMGYGLAIARKNLRKFGGEIEETGLAGQGVSFQIFLPLVDPGPSISST